MSRLVGNLFYSNPANIEPASETVAATRCPNSSKTVLVTGGAGFLGSHLCEFLIRQGHRVVCADNFSTGMAENVQHLRSSGAFTVLRHDVVDPIDLKVDEIYNLACPASPPHYQADPIHTTRTSVLGALNLLELASRCGARIFQASTSEVYGDPNVHPQVETYWGNVNPFGPRSFSISAGSPSPLMVMLAPSAAKALAMARPMPLVEPVTSAFFEVREPMVMISRLAVGVTV